MLSISLCAVPDTDVVPDAPATSESVSAPIPIPAKIASAIKVSGASAPRLDKNIHLTSMIHYILYTSLNLY
jgi:hypothetical protein